MDHPALPEMQSLVAAGDEDGVLRLLLRVWAEERPAPVASAIEALSPRFLFRCAPLVTQETWLASASTRDPLRVTALLATPWGSEGRKILYRRLQALMAFPPDPRIGAFASEALRRLPAGRPTAAEVEAVVLRLMARHGTPADARPGVPGHEALAALALSLPPPLERQLLDAVFGAPGDDGPRRVYADYLLSTDNVLGPLFAHKPRKRLPPGLHAWWVGQLFEQPPKRVDLRWGFPDKVGLYNPTLPSRGWRTVQEICTSDVRWLEGLGPFPQLSELILGIQPARGQAPFAEIPAHLASAPIQRLAWPWSLWSPAPLGEAWRWPHLRSLSLSFADRTLRLDEAALGSVARLPLAVEIIYGDPLLESIGLTWEITRTAGPGIHQVSLGATMGTRLALERSGEGGPLDVVKTNAGNHDSAALSRLLAPLPASEVRLLQVDAGGRLEEAPLRSALSRFGRVEVLRAR